MKPLNYLIICGTFLLVGCLLVGCGIRAVEGPQVIRLAVTTSTRDSGLLDQLVPVFEKTEDVRVDVLAVGTGAALKLGESGDVDVVLVHAREAEEAFMAGRHGVRREEVMYNEFEILGPSKDPAAISELSPSAALRKIADSGHTFVSRGDDSGTHQREKKLWIDFQNRPSWDGYVESGQEMGATLMMADQMSAYVLSDHGTYLKFRHQIQLVPLVRSSESLRNTYGIMVVNPQKHPSINVQLANTFVDFMIGVEAQQIIRDYNIDGEQLFYPLRLTGK